MGPAQAPSPLPEGARVGGEALLASAGHFIMPRSLCSNLVAPLKYSDFQPVICFLEVEQNSHVPMKEENTVTRLR